MINLVMSNSVRSAELTRSICGVAGPVGYFWQILCAPREWLDFDPQNTPALHPNCGWFCLKKFAIIGVCRSLNSQEQ